MGTIHLHLARIVNAEARFVDHCCGWGGRRSGRHGQWRQGGGGDTMVYDGGLESEPRRA
jgi:hypothetical protein